MKLRVLFLILGLTFFTAEAYSDVVFGGEVVVKTGETREEAVSIGDDVRVYGTLSQDAVSLGGDVIIENGGKINGDAVSIGGDITVRSGARVSGDVVTLGGLVNAETGGVIDGEKVSLLPQLPPFFTNPSGVNNPFDSDFHHIIYKILKMIVFWPALGVFGFFGLIFGIVFIVLKLILFLFFSIVITHFFPKNVSNMAGFARGHFIRSAFIGFILSILLPFIILALIITIIGIPTVPPLLMILVFTYLYGSVGVSLMAGRLLPGAQGRSDMANVCIGVFLLMFLKLIPVLGFILKIFFFTASLGVVIYTRYGQNRNEMAKI